MLDIILCEYVLCIMLSCGSAINMKETVLKSRDFLVSQTDAKGVILFAVVADEVRKLAESSDSFVEKLK